MFVVVTVAAGEVEASTAAHGVHVPALVALARSLMHVPTGQEQSHDVAPAAL